MIYLIHGEIHTDGIDSEDGLGIGYDEETRDLYGRASGIGHGDGFCYYGSGAGFHAFHADSEGNGLGSGFVLSGGPE